MALLAESRRRMTGHLRVSLLSLRPPQEAAGRGMLALFLKGEEELDEHPVYALGNPEQIP